jgi:hypothetical protein
MRQRFRRWLSMKIFLRRVTGGDLTDAQIEASEHLFKIMNALKPRLEGKFPNAFENIYEFVAYGVTDVAFIAELRKFNAPKRIDNCCLKVRTNTGQTSFLKALRTDFITGSWDNRC